MKRLAVYFAVAASALVAACSGGGGSSTPISVATATPVATTAPTAAPQVITMSLPSSVIGMETDPTYGLVAGYTQQTYSQVLAFVPGAQVMIANGQAGVPHTLNVLSQTAFPVNPTLVTTASGGSTLNASYTSGTVTNGTMIGPVTLTAGLYYIGCGYHYTSAGMRTVLNVAAAATPGPQATLDPVDATPPPGIY
jgi:hypothetical protein